LLTLIEVEKLRSTLLSLTKFSLFGNVLPPPS